MPGLGVGVGLPYSAVIRGSGVAFSPADLTNLEAWYTTDGPSPPIIVGSGVDDWPDRSGNGHNLRQTVDIKRPTIVASGFAATPDAVLFDAVDDSLISATFTAIPQIHWWTLLMKWDLGNSNDFALGTSATSDGYFSASGTAHRLSLATITPVQDLTAYHYLLFKLDGASSEVYVDGVAGSLSVSPGTGAWTRIALGARGPDDLFGNVRIVEAVLTGGDMTTDERDNLNDYYAERSA